MRCKIIILTLTIVCLGLISFLIYDRYNDNLKQKCPECPIDNCIENDVKKEEPKFMNDDDLFNKFSVNLSESMNQMANTGYNSAFNEIRLNDDISDILGISSISIKSNGDVQLNLINSELIAKYSDKYILTTNTADVYVNVDAEAKMYGIIFIKLDGTISILNYDDLRRNVLSVTDNYQNLKNIIKIVNPVDGGAPGIMAIDISGEIYRINL